MERNTAKDFSVLRKHEQKRKAVWMAGKCRFHAAFLCKRVWNAKEERV